MRYINQNSIDNAFSMMNEARLVVIESLSYASLESTATIYNPLAKLKLIEVSICNIRTLVEILTITYFLLHPRTWTILFLFLIKMYYLKIG